MFQVKMRCSAPLTRSLLGAEYAYLQREIRQLATRAAFVSVRTVEGKISLGYKLRFTMSCFPFAQLRYRLPD